MLSEFINEPIKAGDLVKVVGKGTGIDGTLCRVLSVNNLTASAIVQQVGKYGERSVAIRKLEIRDRPMVQLPLF